MKKPDGAGRLDQRVTFQKRSVEDDGLGGELAAFSDQFTVWAAFIHLRGGEQVLADRLSGVHPVVIRVRRSSNTKLVTSDWRIIDARSGTVYAVRDVSPVDMVWIDFLGVSGEAQ